MATYYAVIPGREDLSAEIDAREKRKAVSEYVRFLSNEGHIPNNQRSYYRKLVKVDRMEPGEINTRYKLQYAPGSSQVQPIAEQIVESVPTQAVRVETEPQEDYFQPTARVEVQEPQVRQSAVQNPNAVGNSPIMVMSRKMGGRS
jgi:hypothetical protein